MDNLLDEISPQESETAAYVQMRGSMRVTQASMLVVLLVLAGYFLWAMSYLYPEFVRQGGLIWRNIPGGVLYPFSFLLVCFVILVFFLFQGIFFIQRFCNLSDSDRMAKHLGTQNIIFLISTIAFFGFPLTAWLFNR